MEKKLKLYMVLVGCTPKGRLTEQHDIFFGIGTSLEELLPDMYRFWPESGKLHVDSWREVTKVGDYAITIHERTTEVQPNEQNQKLFFINLGGYKPGDFEEYHYKKLIVAESMGVAVKSAKKTSFYKHYDFEGAVSHVDDKYALDADDLHNVEDVLTDTLKEKYTINITPLTSPMSEDEQHIGYLKLGKNPLLTP
ncbi:hypothetical protein GCM10007424_12340 [Flavobacterium suaedae]|uniref:DUF1543 domain-containing protein n=1 Tax=Flavobacterium suaedae TaxID=1767027 RepID=A0ABQ1JP35_9FLAO|nr:DUF1543 domain-containing protein [Flavobacterium suaedae]GGB73974.1 hypothetical protein GCM10007424_12340 [Flavobacterium suaedae]